MKAIEIVVLPVKDQQQAKLFYEKLGFRVIVEAPADHGQTWIQMSLPGQPVSIALLAFHGIIVETEDINEDIRVFADRGIHFGDIDAKPWGKFSWVKDADGNSLCLHQK